jgi:hypothetical protein
MDPDKESEDKTDKIIAEIKESINEGRLDARTLLQVDATTIVGVLLFLTLAPFGYNTLTLVVSTAAIVIPFAVSSALIVYTDTNMREYGKLIPMLNKKIFRPVSTKMQARIRLLARGTTFGGFVYLVVVLLFFAIDASPGPSPFPSAAEQCAYNPEKFGVNATNATLWKCSMFRSGSLAELCATDFKRLGVEKTDCIQFIPPQNESPLQRTS